MRDDTSRTTGNRKGFSRLVYLNVVTFMSKSNNPGQWPLAAAIFKQHIDVLPEYYRFPWLANTVLRAIDKTKRDY